MQNIFLIPALKSLRPLFLHLNFVQQGIAKIPLHFDLIGLYFRELRLFPTRWWSAYRQQQAVTEELKIAIENLYDTFSTYPFKSTMEGCPCCVSDTDKEKIHSKQLRNLDEDDLSRYAFKAMTTWGDTDDFKHYLPRIFELLATTDFIVDTFVVLGKLEYGKWQEWSEAEKISITQFLLAWWTDIVKHKTYFDKEAFTEIYKLTNNIEQLLTRWSISFSDNSFSNFVDLIHNYYNDLTNKKKEFKEFDNFSIEKLKLWIQEKSELLEQGFFHFADIDREFADKISTTQYIYERT